MPTGSDPRPRDAVFTEWVKRFTGELVRYARARVKDPDQADDLVQLTFIAAWEGMERFAGESSPRTWLYSILKHKLTDHYRRVYREAAQLSGASTENDDPENGLFETNGHWRAGSGPTTTGTAFDEEDERERLDHALQRCLDTLPPQWRSAIEMKYLLEVDPVAIQEALGISAANYWQQLHRAKLKLRACMEKRTARNTP